MPRWPGSIQVMEILDFLIEVLKTAIYVCSNLLEYMLNVNGTLIKLIKKYNQLKHLKNSYVRTKLQYTRVLGFRFCDIRIYITYSGHRIQV